MRAIQVTFDESSCQEVIPLLSTVMVAPVTSALGQHEMAQVCRALAIAAGCSS